MDYKRHRFLRKQEVRGNFNSKIFEIVTHRESNMVGHGAKIKEERKKQKEENGKYLSALQG